MRDRRSWGCALITSISALVYGAAILYLNLGPQKKQGDAQLSFYCGLVIIAMGMFGLLRYAGHVRDTKRRRRWAEQNRCPDCGYNLKGLAHRRCPECGNVAPPEDDE